MATLPSTQTSVEAGIQSTQSELATNLEAAPEGDRPLAEGERMVIFARTFDFLAWLLPMTNHFPRAQRLSVTQRLLDAALDLRERLEEANRRRGGARRGRLDRADGCLAKIRVYLRLGAARPRVALGAACPTRRHVARLFKP